MRTKWQVKRFKRFLLTHATKQASVAIISMITSEHFGKVFSTRTVFPSMRSDDVNLGIHSDQDAYCAQSQTADLT